MLKIHQITTEKFRGSFVDGCKRDGALLARLNNWHENFLDFAARLDSFFNFTGRLLIYFNSKVFDKVHESIWNIDEIGAVVMLLFSLLTALLINITAAILVILTCRLEKFVGLLGTLQRIVIVRKAVGTEYCQVLCRLRYRNGGSNQLRILGWNVFLCFSVPYQLNLLFAAVWIQYFWIFTVLINFQKLALVHLTFLKRESWGRPYDVTVFLAWKALVIYSFLVKAGIPSGCLHKFIALATDVVF